MESRRVTTGRGPTHRGRPPGRVVHTTGQMDEGSPPPEGTGTVGTVEGSGSQTLPLIYPVPFLTLKETEVLPIYSLS